MPKFKWGGAGEHTNNNKLIFLFKKGKHKNT